MMRSYLSTFTPGKSLTAAPKLKNRFIVDPRIKTSNREVRKKKALNFIKEGTYVKRAEEMLLLYLPRPLQPKQMQIQREWQRQTTPQFRTRVHCLHHHTTPRR